MRITDGRATGAVGIAGIIVPAVGLLILPIWSFPGTAESGLAVADWADQHHVRLQVVMVLNTIGVTLWLVFGAALRTHMRDALATASALPDVFAAGMIGTVSLLLAGFTSFDVLVYRADGLGGSDARLLYDVTFGLLAMSGMPTAVALTAFTIAVWRHDLTSRYVGVLAGLTAGTHGALLSSLIVPSGHLSLEDYPITVVPALLWAWILATGIHLTRRAVRPQRVDAAE